ncbi:MAG: 3-phosphoshikimate 1-carboxyvinyltransferase, partial [Firmicutes bacterium]|nr:3-phosphoshikimate 1-carboxyvinyltransferase [Bacillota bacterium]
TGDESLSSRPMKRVVDPLVSRGADIVSTNDYAPITVFGQNLKDFKYTLPIASAQVKSAILLSGLRASGDTTVIQPIPSRDHTEIMLKAMGADILIKGEKILLNPSILSSLSFCISGDISSASFWMVLAAIKPNCEITINNVNINPTRAGILDVFDQVGVEYSLGNIKSDIEKVADISVKYTKYLKPFVIDSTLIPRLIDEIPILSLLACFCQGQSLINDCSELRVKESDRIASIVECLSALGANIEQKQDSLTISQSDLHGDATVQSYGDHRIALTMEIANLILGNIKVVARECIGVSYPQFFADLEKYREIYK